jgi:hypothetical protein
LTPLGPTFGEPAIDGCLSFPPVVLNRNMFKSFVFSTAGKAVVAPR